MSLDVCNNCLSVCNNCMWLRTECSWNDTMSLYCVVDGKSHSYTDTACDNYIYKYLNKNENSDLVYRDDSNGVDPVNHPDHYISKKGLETITVIEAFTDGLEGMEAVDTAQIIKYICRWKQKNGVQDLEKARWYLDHLIRWKKNS